MRELFEVKVRDAEEIVIRKGSAEIVLTLSEARVVRRQLAKGIRFIADLKKVMKDVNDALGLGRKNAD